MTIADTLKARGVRRVVHFHVDHFEPYRTDASGACIGVDHVAGWISKCRKLAWAGSVSPFYSSWSMHTTPVADRAAPLGAHLTPDGQAWFAESSSIVEERRILDYLCDEDVDMHVHIHHEHWTESAASGMERDEERDNARLALYLELVLAHYRAHRMVRHHWGFIHGCWALAAVDPTVCNVTRELSILHAAGCVADFTFPSGRTRYDPRRKTPFTILPLAGRRVYEFPEALPICAGEGLGAIQPARILIWNSPISTDDVSLDFLTQIPLDAESIAGRWADRGHVTPDGTLWLKTHAHSLMKCYWQDKATTTSPLLHPGVGGVFEAMLRGCEGAKVEWKHMDVTSVLRAFTEVDRVNPE